jgi:hypothetical protein
VASFARGIVIMKMNLSIEKQSIVVSETGGQMNKSMGSTAATLVEESVDLPSSNLRVVEETGAKHTDFSTKDVRNRRLAESAKAIQEGRVVDTVESMVEIGIRRGIPAEEIRRIFKDSEYASELRDYPMPSPKG